MRMVKIVLITIAAFILLTAGFVTLEKVTGRNLGFIDTPDHSSEFNTYPTPASATKEKVVLRYMEIEVQK